MARSNIVFTCCALFLVACSSLPMASAFGTHSLQTHGPRQRTFSVPSSKTVLQFQPRHHHEAASTSASPTKQALAKFVTSTAIVASVFFHSTASFADGQTKDFRLPPIDFTDKSRCVLNSSKMGQANAARDKLYDLRMCDLSGKDASGYDLSGVIMTKTDLSNSNLKEAQFSKGYLHESNFDGADFTNGIVDRASFKGSSMKGAIFTNAVLTGTSFEDANLENSDFSDAYIGDFDVRNLCKNPTLKGENPVTGADTYASAGCLGIKRK